MTQSQQLLTTGPENAIIDQGVVDRLIGEASRLGLPLNALVVWQAGRIRFEDYWWPHSADTLHMTHSATKSFTGTAVGFAEAEGLLNLQDRVYEFFPELNPATLSENQRAMTVEDLLTMRTGHEFGLSGGEWRLLQTSWVHEFFKAAVPHAPGQNFIYSSASSHILSAIVQRASGQTVQDLLRPRLFEPLGITDYTWDHDPEGITSGGNGLKLTVRDFLKWGVVHLQGGRWEGQQVVPAGWVAQATRPHVSDVIASPFDGKRYQKPTGSETVREGYGYQIWCGPEGSFYASGMFGQACIALPEIDAVVAVNAAVPSDRAKLLVPSVFRVLLDRDQAADSETIGESARLTMSMPPKAGGRDRRLWARLDGEWNVDENPYCITQIGVTSEAPNAVQLTVTDSRGANTLTAGLGTWFHSRTGLTTAALHHSYQEQDAKVVAAVVGHTRKAVEIECYFTETPFRDNVRLLLTDEETLSIDWRVNINSGPTQYETLTAHRAQPRSV